MIQQIPVTDDSTICGSRFTGMASQNHNRVIGIHIKLTCFKRRDFWNVLDLKFFTCKWGKSQERFGLCGVVSSRAAKQIALLA